MGMGKYQWQLFTLCGFGWMADNLWLQGVALTLDPIAAEFGVDSNAVRYTTLALFVGLLALTPPGHRIIESVSGQQSNASGTINARVTGNMQTRNEAKSVCASLG